MPVLLETDSLTNQSLVASTAIGAHTASAAVELVYCRVLTKDMAGNGDYEILATITSGGTLRRMIPITTANAASGVTAWGAMTIPLLMFAGEVLTIWLKGLAGDNANCDTQVDFAVSNALEPTTAARTLDVAATGEAGLDFDNVRAATAPTTLTNITVPDVSNLATYTGNTKQTGDAYAQIGVAGASLTALGDTRIANLDAAVSSRAATGADADTLETLSDQIDLIDVSGVPDAVLDEVVEGTYTLRQMVRLVASKLFGDWDKIGSVVTYNDLADAKARITETLTSTGRDVTALDGT
jgi:hypothetical protein